MVAWADCGSRAYSAVYRLMSDPQSACAWRPEVGFIVEGQCEVAAYPTLLAALLGYPVGHFPIALAGGCDRLLVDLHGLLDDLCRTRMPKHVIITVDSMDFNNHPQFGDCKVLRGHLAEQSRAWLSARSTYSNGITLPDSVVPVVQHRAFETWIIADPVGLRAVPELIHLDESVAWTDVDTEIQNPVKWLRDRIKGAVNTKNPLVLKRLAAALNPTRMREVSPSYDKFCREIQRTL